MLAGGAGEYWKLTLTDEYTCALPRHSPCLHRVDAFVHSATVDHKHIPITYHIPGWVATLALVVMNITSRRELAEPEELYVDENFAVSCTTRVNCSSLVCICAKFFELHVLQARAKIILFISYLMAFGAVAGSIAVLITCVQHNALVDIGVVCISSCFTANAMNSHTGQLLMLSKLQPCRAPCCNAVLFCSVACCFGRSDQLILLSTEQ